MSKALKYSIASFLAACFIIGMGFLLHLSREQQALIACKELSVSFEDSLRFVTESDIRGYLAEGYGDFIGQKLDSVKLDRIEEILESKSAILNTEAWTSSDGVLHLSVTQRAPALRFQNGDKGFYVDDRGFIFPLHPSFTAPVPVVTGAIPVNVPEGFKGEAESIKERTWIDGMLSLNGFVSGSKRWSDSVSDIRVSENGDVIVGVREGDEEFILGEAEDIPDKFSKIGRYYEYILPEKGQGYYKYVNVKYKNQIVCRKDM